MEQSITKKSNRDEVKKFLVAYLEKNKLRKTPERFAILEEIYKSDDHVDAESLYFHLKKMNYRISRATVYNTLDLLIECGLVRKHQFGENIAKFEGTFGQRQHDHMICTECSNVYEFCDPRIQLIKNMMGELLNFEVTGHSLHLFGKPLKDAKGNCVSCNHNLSR